jgi:hypothetical protein
MTEVLPDDDAAAGQSARELQRGIFTGSCLLCLFALFLFARPGDDAPFLRDPSTSRAREIVEGLRRRALVLGAG